MSVLPEGWITAEVNDLTSDISYGYTAKASVEPIGPRMLRITDIQDNDVEWSTVPFCKITDTDKSKYFLKDGDIVFARTGATVGKSFRISSDIPDAVFASYLIRVRCVTESLSKYLNHYFKSPLYWTQITEFSSGIGQPNVNGTKLKQLQVPLAPLAEQKRIADKLDALLARVDRARTRLDRVPLILKRFRQAVLSAATSGQLTEDWREENENVESIGLFLEKLNLPVDRSMIGSSQMIALPEHWAMIKFGTFVTTIRGGTTAVPHDEQTDFPILRSSSVRPGFVDLEDIRYVSEKDSQNNLNYLTDEDMLFTRLSGSLEYVANCAKVRGLKGRKIQYPDRLFCAKLRSYINSTYFELAFASPFVRKQIVENAKSSAGHQRVSITDITNQWIPVAPVEEQHEIVRRVEILFAFADRLQARYQAARSQVDQLTPALLAQAFRGELVPQDPNDEPAALLLERIRKNLGK